MEDIGGKWRKSLWVISCAWLSNNSFLNSCRAACRGLACFTSSRQLSNGTGHPSRQGCRAEVCHDGPSLSLWHLICLTDLGLCSQYLTHMAVWHWSLGSSRRDWRQRGMRPAPPLDCWMYSLRDRESDLVTLGLEAKMQAAQMSYPSGNSINLKFVSSLKKEICHRWWGASKVLRWQAWTEWK